MPNGVSGRFSPLANSQARAAHTPVHTPAPASISTPLTAHRGPVHLHCKGVRRGREGLSRPSSAQVAPASVRTPTLSKPVTPSPS